MSIAIAQLWTMEMGLAEDDMKLAVVSFYSGNPSDSGYVQQDYIVRSV